MQVFRSIGQVDMKPCFVRYCKPTFAELGTSVIGQGRLRSFHLSRSGVMQVFQLIGQADMYCLLTVCFVRYLDPTFIELEISNRIC